MQNFDVNAIRKDFPVLNRQINSRPLVYFDNTATTQKPRQVIEALSDYYSNYNANVHRAVHTLGSEATEKYEATRVKVAGFIKSQGPEEIIFTRNATESLNLVAFSLGSLLKEGDEVVTTIMEHHSNIVPWQMLESRGIKVKYIDINEDGTLKMEQYEKLITKKTRIVTVTHVSNLIGTINQVKKIGELAHAVDATFVVDGAQSAPHMPVDVVNMDADFFAFSAHKMLGPMGIGVLYGKRHILESMPPFLRGGDMIKEVTTSKTTFNDLPYKFEAGTPNVGGAIAFGQALDYLNHIGMDNVRRHEKETTDYALKQMESIPNLTIYGPSVENRAGVISFNIGDIHSHDVASLLDGEGIAIRSGHGCAMPLVNRLGTNSVCRASFYIYNTKEEVDTMINAIEKVKRIFKVD